MPSDSEKKLEAKHQREHRTQAQSHQRRVVAELFGDGVGSVHPKVAQACNEVVQVSPNQAQGNQLEKPAGQKLRTTGKHGGELGVEISDVRLLSNIQMMKGMSTNIKIPLTRCRMETMPAGGSR